MSLTAPELVRLHDLNFAESLREQARWSPAGVISERDDALRTLSATRFPAGVFNTVFCTGETPDDADAWLARQLAFFQAEQRGCSVYTRAHDRSIAEACTRAGLKPAGAAPCMAIEAPVATAAEAEHVESLEAMAEWCDVQASAYVSLGLPEQVAREVMPSPARMLGPHAVFMLARVEGVAAAGAMVLLSHGIAGVYWVGVRPERRKRGLGELVTGAVTNAAFARGARAVVLQASPMGLPIYEKLGFREITRHPWFIASSRRPTPA